MFETWLLIILVSQVTAFAVNYLGDTLPEPRRLRPKAVRQLDDDKVRGYDNKFRALTVHATLLAAFVFFFNVDISNWGTADMVLIFGYFTLVAVIDVEHRLILNSVSLIGVLFLGSIGVEQHGWTSTLTGGVAGFVIFYVLFLLAQWLAKWVSARREEELSEVPFGGGDVNLAGVIGLLVGWPGVIAGLFLGLVLAGVYSAGLIVWRWARGRYKAFDTIPLGPFLGAGAMLAIILSAAV